MTPIYLDYNATTPVDPAAVGAMRPYLEREFGNPSSTHAYGRAARRAVDEARSRVAGLLAARPDEVVLTGGGTEASNLAIKGVVLPLLFGRAAPGCADVLANGTAPFWRRLLPSRPFRARPHVITTAVEHPATLQPCAFLRRLGCDVTVLPVDRTGRADPDALRRALRRRTALVTVMHSNNEVGTLQPVREMARLAHERGALVHTDAAQSLGKLPVNARELDVDLLTVAGHKLYAPKGVGALYVRGGVDLEPVLHGAGHEGGRRAGTENVPYLVALGEACRLAEKSLPAATANLRRLRDRLWQRLREGLGERVTLNGHPEERLPNTLNVNFAGQVGAELLAAVPEVAASTGSACHEGHVTLSPVLRAMGVPPELGCGAVRLSVGRWTTEEEVDRAARLLVAAARARDAKPADAAG
jgi:cysteine desulfurase